MTAGTAGIDDRPEIAERQLVGAVSWSRRAAVLAAGRLDPAHIGGPALKAAFEAALACSATDGYERCELVDAAVAHAGYQPPWLSVLRLADLAPVLSDESGRLAAVVRGNGERRLAREALARAWHDLGEGALDPGALLAALGRVA